MTSVGLIGYGGIARDLVAALRAQDDAERPVRIAAGVADQTGRVHLEAVLRDLPVLAGARIQILAVDHGWARPERGAAHPDELVAWEPGWSPAPAAPAGDSRHTGRVIGCATFWMRGGVDSLN